MIFEAIFTFLPEANNLNHHESSFYSEILLATDANCVVFLREIL